MRKLYLFLVGNFDFKAVEFSFWVINLFTVSGNVRCIYHFVTFTITLDYFTHSLVLLS